jgi:8-oxo-dGTP pyrophosphatase MutT (NUDIX family)
MRAVDCVGALIRDDQQRVYVQRRTAERRLLPGIWDIVGGHVEAGETPEQALAREVEEETGWNRTDGDRRLRDIVAHAVRTRFTERLMLVPITGPDEVLPGHAADLERLHADPWVAVYVAYF